MTNTIIAKMLRENTGRHFMDSGDAYGRNWERNQGRSFDGEPEATVDFKYDIEVTINVYHFLKDRLTLSEKLDRKFKRFCNRPENADESYFALVAKFVDTLDASGLYGEGSPLTVNTYNGEDLLSQVIQFTLFRLDHTDYVILQIHGGADVRGGYTTPRVFEVNGDATCMFDNARATIYCTGDRNACGAYWDTENGCSWHRDGNYVGPGQLQDYDRTSEEKGETWEAGKLHVLADRSALCPCCGSPLKAAQWPGG
jgi:hypothetical protein